MLQERPLDVTKRLTHSMTSRNTSFLRYRTPSDRHDTAFVTAIGGRGASSFWPSCVMYLKSMDVWCKHKYSLLSKNASLGDLRIPEVHHLVEELVDDDEVVADRLLLDVFEVLREYLDQLVEKGLHQRDVHVLPRCCDN